MQQIRSVCFNIAASLAAAIALAALPLGAAYANTHAPLAGTSGQDDATVVVRRDATVSCYDAIPATIFVDGKAVTLVGGGQTAELRMPAGTYRFGIALDSAGNGMYSVPVQVAAQHPTTLRADVTMTGYTIRTTH